MISVRYDRKNGQRLKEIIEILKYNPAGKVNRKTSFCKFFWLLADKKGGLN